MSGVHVRSRRGEPGRRVSSSAAGAVAAIGLAEDDDGTGMTAAGVVVFLGSCCSGRAGSFGWLKGLRYEGCSRGSMYFAGLALQDLKSV